MSNIFQTQATDNFPFIRYIKQILVAFYSGQSLKSQVLGDVKTMTMPSCLQLRFGHSHGFDITLGL